MPERKRLASLPVLSVIRGCPPGVRTGLHRNSAVAARARVLIGERTHAALVGSAHTPASECVRSLPVCRLGEEQYAAASLVSREG